MMRRERVPYHRVYVNGYFRSAFREKRIAETVAWLYAAFGQNRRVTIRFRESEIRDTVEVVQTGQVLH